AVLLGLVAVQTLSAVDLQKVQSILARCTGCHGASQQMRGLRLDQKTSALDATKLIERVSSTTPGFRMPPSGVALNAAEIGLLREWITSGAPFPATTTHWAFQPIGNPAAPAVKNANWPRTPIDNFVLQRLEAETIAPSPEADRVTLIRRVTFDVTGLPPTPAEVDAFVNDSNSGAYERVVTRLLQSPHYGEQWARHWLDAARYADSDGYEKDLVRPYAWRWRQYVIDALNRDLPFDQFTVEQIAGDLLPRPQTEQLVATGFHRNTLTNREGGIDREQLRIEQIIDRTNTVGTVWLGLSVGCAQCHDHKYDPISQKEYYQLFAFFNNLDETEIDAPVPGELGPHLRAYQSYRRQRDELIASYGVEPLQREWEPKVIAAGREQGKYGGNWDLAWTVLWNDERQILLKDLAKRTEKERDKLTDHFLEWYSAVVTKQRYAELKFDELRKKLAALRSQFPEVTQAPIIYQVPQTKPTHLLLRGDFRSPGPEVHPATPAALPALPSNQPTRLDLAKWLVSRDNPLTARVFVNRSWQQFFGTGLVRTVDNFGLQGERPTHPELLDWLAAQFRDNGWSIKQLHRTIVLSAAYRQSSHARRDVDARDPMNSLLARQSRLRLPAENVRDAALAVSGLLHPRIGGRSVRPPQPKGVSDLTYGTFGSWVEDAGRERYRRGLYIHFQRSSPYPLLMNFDAPDANVACVVRRRSNTPLQALNLLNDPVFVEAAQALAVRTLRESTPSQRLEYAFRLAVGRSPTAAELRHLNAFLDELQSGNQLSASQLAPFGLDPRETAVFTHLGRLLLNLDEFVTRE
ncbi:MAG: PSD1 domain-containing protein, partial [Bryobacterales bacterium]|nr:PSD1 domain-containing protein [Bryobacterales bacterium]